jgi:hypothetical protein
MPLKLAHWQEMAIIRHLSERANERTLCSFRDSLSKFESNLITDHGGTVEVFWKNNERWP